jgi:hypothetical protein
MRIPSFTQRSGKMTIRSNSVLLIAIPLLLSTFTHLWNPIGFPSVHTDEGHYMLRVTHVLEGLGPQEPKSIYTKPYDHPYFGQIFLAAVLGTIGYPHALNPIPGDLQSIQMLYMFPRAFMGLLAIADTFLLYKIVERRYDRKVAFVAAIIFAVMPVTWLLRRILLDNLLLPFLLSSIFFAICVKKPIQSTGSSNGKNIDDQNRYDYTANNFLLAVSSGIFVGLAISTKIPAITFIPLIALLIFMNSNKNLKLLGLWFIPVILLPLIWPTYAALSGGFQEWKENIIWQATERFEVPLSDAIRNFHIIDPVLLVLSISGLFYSALKKDVFLLVWVIPYLIFLTSVGHVAYWHFVPVFPAFCIAAARLIISLIRRISMRINIAEDKLYLFVVCGTGLFGLTMSILLVSTNVTSGYFETIAFIVRYVPENAETKDTDPDTKEVTVIGGRWVPGFSWIPTYVFDRDVDFRKFYIPTESITPKKLFIVDPDFSRFISSNKNEDVVKRIRAAYDGTELVFEINQNPYTFDLQNYPYSVMKIVRTQTMNTPLEIRSNY